MRIRYLSAVIGLCPFMSARADVGMENARLRVRWENRTDGWHLTTLALKSGGEWIQPGIPSGSITLIGAIGQPDSTKPAGDFRTLDGGDIRKDHEFLRERWDAGCSEVALNLAGVAQEFFPQDAARSDAGELRFTRGLDCGEYSSTWSLDPDHPCDILVTHAFRANRDGFYSLATPTLATIADDDFAWAAVPGYFQGSEIERNLPLSYAYGHGVPDRPVIYRERAASTLCPLVTSRNGVTLSIIPAPGQSRRPWTEDGNHQEDWLLGLSHRNRAGRLSPTLYQPVLGQQGSAMKAGGEVRFSFRYSLTVDGWFAAIKHAACDVYRLKDSLVLRESKEALSRRLERLHSYSTDPVTSLWRVEENSGLRIGAQAYLGSVKGADGDAMKNADYGAMWMFGRCYKDSPLSRSQLPLALNFKLAQQETAEGFFKGAVKGQYYLSKSGKWVEEWAEIIEPIGVTYYTLIDLGNILLFEPDNEALKARLRAGAEWLLHTQKPDGSWAVAYDRRSETEIYGDVMDLRPTFYGMLAAHRILGDPRYLAAARRGADRLIEQGVNKGRMLGVCGDIRYMPDFATAQTAQALLDLHDLTGERKYRDAAILAAEIYVCSIYTHPIPTRGKVTAGGREREEWEISQVGLGFEHGGLLGSANNTGPILLASHAGLFVRMAGLTGDRIFLDLARIAAIGRDAFVHPETAVASYYWKNMNQGAGPYPHHAWWQIGWITDYLLAEAEYRSAGKVKFPRGFVAPKVGPHQSVGFAPGEVSGRKAKLVFREGFVKAGSASIDHILAEDLETGRLHVILLNNRAAETTFSLRMGEGVMQEMQMQAFGVKILMGQ